MGWARKCIPGKWRGFSVAMGRWLYPTRPLEFAGEINTQNKNKGKINNCGFDPMRTEVLAVSMTYGPMAYHDVFDRTAEN